MPRFSILHMLIGAVLLTAFADATIAQTYDTLKICTYNVLNYPPTDTSRNAAYRKILRAIDPDILVVQEMNSSSGLTQFLNNVMNAGRPGTYSAAPYSNDSSDNGLYYKPLKVSFISPAGITSDSIDFQIYSMHLKASTGSENEQRRAVAAESLRTRLNSLPDGGFFIGAGDLNLYTNAEQAWINLTGSTGDNSGRLYDPLNRAGSWSDNPSYADIHTQSTRTEDLGDGGAVGGLDDRFDFVLLSYTFPNPAGWDYVSGSYTEYGNDGAHFDTSVNAGTNYAVPDSIADALYEASDHLPVYLKVRRLVGPPPSITVTYPNGSEILYTGNACDLTWSSVALNGTVTLRLNRSFPSSTWDTLVTGTANDGSYIWPAAAPLTTTARLEVISDAIPTVHDTSDANFEIRAARITVIAPSGGESWPIGQNRWITWTSEGVPGSVNIELNRNFPTGGWETLYSGLPNDGSESWPVSGPATTHARVRIYAAGNPAARDSSQADFTVAHSGAPVIAHDPHGDGLPGWTVFTAKVTDDLGLVSVMMFYRKAAAAVFDSVAMTPAGGPNEYADSLLLGFGRYEYFVRATDSDPQAVRTDTFEFVLSALAGTLIAYDDGTAELYNWGQPDSFRWAVRFTPPQTPFLLGDVSFGVAGFHPDTAHGSIRVKVFLANGESGMPGSLLREVVRGSVGNVIGGLPAPGMYTATVILHDSLTDPLILNSDFYVSVENKGPGEDAFAMDTSSLNSGRSVVFDPCAGEWLQETGVDSNSRNGNRMISVRGWSAVPQGLVISASGNDVVLNWRSCGAPYYHVYEAASWGGTLQFLSSTTDTTYVAYGAVPAAAKKFYHVTSSSSP
jgi:endonuclease/exonuclease/phosphatase family metal-dependent hydrolase